MESDAAVAAPMLTSVGIVIAGIILPLLSGVVRAGLGRLRWAWIAGQGATVTAALAVLVYLGAWQLDGADPAQLEAYLRASGAVGVLGVLVHTQAKHAPAKRREVRT